MRKNNWRRAPRYPTSQREADTWMVRSDDEFDECFDASYWEAKYKQLKHDQLHRIDLPSLMVGIMMGAIIMAVFAGIFGWRF